MGYRKGYYRKDGTYVQGHYANNRSKFSNKNNGCMFLILAFIAISSIISCSDSGDSGDSTEITSGSSSGSSSNSNCPTKICGDFKSQADAQKTFESNKKCYKNLDGDGNGKACEHLK